MSDHLSLESWVRQHRRVSPYLLCRRLHITRAEADDMICDLVGQGLLDPEPEGESYAVRRNGELKVEPDGAPILQNLRVIVRTWDAPPFKANAKLIMRHFRKVWVAENGCWLWRGAVQSDGYGNLGINGQWWLAHRWFYTVLVGPIPDGLTVDHLCFNRICVNVAHMEAITRSENLKRAKARITHCVNGHAYTEQNTYRRPNGRRICRICRVRHQRMYQLRHGMLPLREPVEAAT